MPSSRRLFVAGLPDGVTEEVLSRLFEAASGAPVAVSLPKDRATGRPRGYALVTMPTVASAETAHAALDGSLHFGRPMAVRPFVVDPSAEVSKTAVAGSAWTEDQAEEDRRRRDEDARRRDDEQRRRDDEQRAEDERRRRDDDQRAEDERRRDDDARAEEEDRRRRDDDERRLS